MKDRQEKKTRLFLANNGKCEYCGVDMILFYTMWPTKNTPENLATLDHKYNRDHEGRIAGNTSKEKRIYIVCWKCNNEKAKSEPNLQQHNGVEKTTKKLAPKEKWSDNKFMERLQELVVREKEIAKENSDMDKQIAMLNRKKSANQIKLSKAAKYRNQLIEIHKESEKCHSQIGL